MADIRRIKTAWRKSDNRDIPVVAFRYSKNKITEKTDLKFTRCMRAEIYVHLQGDGVFFVGDNMHQLKYGDVLLYNKNEIHFATIGPNTVWERFVIFFLPEYMDFINDLDDHLFNFFYQRNNYEYNLISLPKESRKRLIELLFQIDGFDGKNDFDNQLFCYMNFVRVLQIINEGYVEPQPQDASDKIPKTVNDILDYINRNFSQNLTLDTIARKMNISKSYLSSVFKKHIGTSPYEYLLCVRLDCAKRLLASGENIANACYFAGFNDYSHFIQFFKKRVGMTPHKYSKLNAEENSDITV